MPWGGIRFSAASIGRGWRPIWTILGTDLVAVSLVTDPFGRPGPAELQRCFPDVMIPFKQHFVVDLRRPVGDTVGKRHRKHAMRALKQLTIDVIDDAHTFLDEWLVLYDALIARHGITGLRAFSRRAFARQLAIPGTSVLAARHEGRIVGAQIYFLQGDAVFCHLGAFSEAGYELGVSHALDWTSIEHFHGKAAWLDLGGGAGRTSDGSDGLSRYKSGWTDDLRQAYFCGRICNPDRYREILATTGTGATDYFPAYRHGEFA